MITLIADSGSTKTDWALRSDEKTIGRVRGHGLNPTTMTEETLRTYLLDDIAEIKQTMLGANINVDDAALTIRFYGAGCRGEGIARLSALLSEIVGTSHVSVDGDQLAAARALLGTKAGIACILGTGSNACRYDGQAIMPGGVPSLGYILGDEGGGVSLGRRLLSDAAKRQLPDSICNALFAIEGVSIDSIIQHVYRGATPARYLASFVPFIVEHRNEKAIHALLVEEFSRFIRRNILPLQPEIHEAVHFVGGVAKTFCAELEEALYHHTLTLGEVIQAPFDRLENL